MNGFDYTYTLYLSSLTTEQKCACQRAPRGRCPWCNVLPTQEHLPIEPFTQLELFSDQETLYTRER